MNKNNKIEKIFCEVMELKNIPKNFDKMKIGDITQWDSLANMNLLMALEKTLKFDSEKISDTSLIINGLRKSGLSVPYISIESLYEMRGNGEPVTAQGSFFL